MEPEEQDQWRRVDHFVSAPLEDGVVILDLEDGNYYFLSETALSIWEFLARPRSITEIGDELTARYEVARDRCVAATRAFLDELAGKHLVEQLPGSGGT
jgi:Coenzyme PQQ synthesis protein D (PqqD)